MDATEQDRWIAFGRSLLDALPPVPSPAPKSFGGLAKALNLDLEAAGGAWFACMANGIKERPYISQTDFLHGLAVYAAVLRAASPDTPA
jgi:hypothetical protein